MYTACNPPSKPTGNDKRGGVGGYYSVRNTYSGRGDWKLPLNVRSREVRSTEYTVIAVYSVPREGVTDEYKRVTENWRIGGV